MSKPILSVVILNFNTKKLLKECLRSVYLSTGFGKGELEVTVVDNRSTDGSATLVEREFPQAKLITNRVNLGFSAGNNLGLKQAEGEYLLLLNSDTLVEKETLSVMVRFIQHDPKIGAATCRLVLANGKIDPASHRGFPTPWNALTYISGLEKLFPGTRIFGGYHQGWKNYSAPHEADVISGAFFMIPRKVIDKVGLLDESFFMYGEDIDWCFRIKQAGFEIWYNPEAKILHYKKQSGRAKISEQRTENREQSAKSRAEYHFVYTMEQFYRKHYMKKYPKLVNWLVFSVINIWKKIL